MHSEISSLEGRWSNILIDMSRGRLTRMNIVQAFYVLLLFVLEHIYWAITLWCYHERLRLSRRIRAAVEVDLLLDHQMSFLCRRKEKKDEDGPTVCVFTASLVQMLRSSLSFRYVAPTV